MDDNELHDFKTPGTSWATTNNGLSYFASGTGRGPITLIIDLGEDTNFNQFLTWAYGGSAGEGSTKQGNNVRAYSLKFATSAEGIANFGTSITYNPSFTQSASAIPGVDTDTSENDNVIAPDIKDLGQTLNARYIQMTITSNYYNQAGFMGGDRVGLGHIAVAIPEPSSAALALLGTLCLVRRKRR